MFRKVKVEIWIENQIIYHSEGKTLIGVMLKIAAMLTVYSRVDIIITIK